MPPNICTQDKNQPEQKSKNKFDHPWFEHVNNCSLAVEIKLKLSSKTCWSTDPKKLTVNFLAKQVYQEKSPPPICDFSKNI